MTETASISAEHQVIGAVFSFSDLAASVDLNPEDFSEAPLGRVWQEIQEMIAASLPVECLTVCERLEKSTGVNYLPLIGRAMADCVSRRGINQHVTLIKKNAKARKAKVIAADLLATADDDGIDNAIQSLMALNSLQRKYECGMQEALSAACERLDEVHSKGGLPGITSGLKDIDEVLGGFHETDLYIVGARPAMGKTAFLLNLALSAGMPVGVISAEQPSEQMATRCISIEGRIHANRLRNADLEEDEWARLSATAGKLVDREIRFFDKAAPSIVEVVRQSRSWIVSHGIKALYVDYIQRIRAINQSVAKHEQVGQVVMSLKELARELNIPVIALAQVNRSVESRTDKRPMMGDLKDSGVIEQEADNVMMLYRDEVYDEESLDKGVAEISVEKNRHGPTGMKKVAWDGRIMKFSDLYQYSDMA
jgi:replicative DNA helicase